MPKKTSQKCSEGNTKEPLSTIEKPAGRSRDWCFTLYQSRSDPPCFFADDCKYLIYGSELCPTTGRHHWQCYVVWNYQKTFNAMRKYYKGAHVEPIKGSSEDNIRYCKKGEQPKDEWNAYGMFGPNWGLNSYWKEFGKAPAQGERGDLIEIKSEILNGEKTCEDIICENPMLYHQYGRTFDKIEDIFLRKQYRTEMTKGIWYWGSTGIGKSHKAFENYSPDTHYSVPKDGVWWDGYRQQPIVIINEFRGHIKYDELLELVDKWPKDVPRRCRQPMPFTSKLVIVTSSLPPEEVYHNRNSRDSLEQLHRRFEIIHLT